MFVFTRNAKLLAIALMIVGAVGLIIGFTSPATSLEETHATEAHATETHATEAHATEAPATEETHATEAHATEAHATAAPATEEAHATEAHATEAHATGAPATEEAHASHPDQSGNRPWAALLVNSIFFLSFGIGATFFLAVQYAAQAGWSAGLTRVFEAVALWVIVPLVVIFIIAVAGVQHVHGIWHWMHEGVMDPASPNYDAIIAGKEAFLNAPFFLARLAMYIVIWFGAAYLFRRNSIKEDGLPKGQNLWGKQRALAATFLVLYAVTSSTSAWDIIMSIDVHWFSTLFGWYTFAGMFVTGLTVLNILVIYLRVGGHMPWINENHQHDLGKFMFAFSIFWTYLWFSQYMLIWYANIPEEVTYYLARFGEYKLYFIAMLALNFLVPFLLMIGRDNKRIVGFILFAAFFVLIGHWMDHYIMIMPGAVGLHYGFGPAEWGGFLFYSGLFIYFVLSQLSKAPLIQKNHPLLKESELFHQ